MISQKIKRCLASLSAIQKDLSSLDESLAEIGMIGRTLDGRSGELAELEGRLARAREEFAKDDAAHSDWRQKAAKEQQKTNAQIDLRHQELEALEQQVAERRAESDSIMAGMEALSRRLRVG